MKISIKVSSGGSSFSISTTVFYDNFYFCYIRILTHIYLYMCIFFSLMVLSQSCFWPFLCSFVEKKKKMYSGIEFCSSIPYRFLLDVGFNLESQ